MPESRTNPKRKGKVKAAATTSKDYSNEPIYRQPTWNPDDLFTINGQTLEMFAAFVSPYREMIKMVDAIIGSGELEDKVKIEFYYPDGTLVPNTDPRLANLREKEDKRIADWKRVVAERQEQMKQWAEKAKEAMASMSDSVEQAEAKINTLEQE